jgi:hypothetical protein
MQNGKIGTDDEIMAQRIALEEAEIAVMKAKLRLRALRGEPLLASGDSFNAFETGEYVNALVNEFGARNIRMF